MLLSLVDRQRGFTKYYHAVVVGDDSVTDTLNFNYGRALNITPITCGRESDRHRDPRILSHSWDDS